MDTVPLPPRPDLDQYKKRAKNLVKAAVSPEAVHDWATEWLDALARLWEEPVRPFVQASIDRAVDALEKGVKQPFTLADAQSLIARAHGFDNWAAFARHVSVGTGTDPFEAAADAIVTGDLDTLASLLRQHPGLHHARSAREHRATLLHYVAANGVEDFRQKSPPNAVAVATALLRVGAEVDATAHTYGGGRAQTTMNLLVSSVHPAAAGVHVDLVGTLLDFGAAINGLDDDGSPLMTALAFGYVEAAEALARRGARIDNVIAAAALGDTGLVERFMGAPVAPSLVSLYWLGLSSDPRTYIERAFVWACRYGRPDVVEFLLPHVDPAATDPMGMTGLHWAAGNAHLTVVRLLTGSGAPLETRNRWGGTVLSTTVYLAQQRSADWERYSAVIDVLIAAGADVEAVRFPTGVDHIDDHLRPFMT